MLEAETLRAGMLNQNYKKPSDKTLQGWAKAFP